MASPPSPEQMSEYVSTARRRHAQEQAALEQRVQHAWELAHEAARILRSQFGASRVVVFGSLTREGMFTPQSDVDIAVWGLSPADTLKALGAVYDLSSDIRLNLVDVKTAYPAIYEIIVREDKDI